MPGPVIKIVDVKCPGSGEAHRNDWANLDRLAPHDEVKFVIKDRADYEYARDIVAKHRPERPRAPRSCSRRSTASWTPASSRPGSSRTSSTSACSCRRTSSSGAPTFVASSPRAVVLLSGGLDSYTAGAMARARRLRALRADGPLRPGPRARGGGGAPRRRRAARRSATSSSTSTSRRSAGPRWSATATSRRIATSPPRTTSRRPTCRRATPCSSRWRWPGRKWCGADRDRHRRQRARLLRLSGLPP